MKDAKPVELFVGGIPETVPDAVAAVCRSRLLGAVADLSGHLDTPEILVTVGNEAGLRGGRKGRERPESGALDDLHPQRYAARDPYFTFGQLVVPDALMTELIAAIEVLRVEGLVFDQWGLRAIEPFPRTALNFHGPPGTGKTLAAHALANRLGKQILAASYAEIESKFHGDGPKNVQAIFRAAELDRAVLFIDEADSLLSRRLTNVTQGSEQAINSMRSQLLICLEQFHGVVIFSTNLVGNYDKAFETRVRHIEFPMPDESCRGDIWARHLVPQLPTAHDVDPQELGIALDDLCGRDIKNAVIDAAVRVAVSGRANVERKDLVAAAERLKAARVSTGSARPLTSEEAQNAKQAIRAALDERSVHTQGEDGRVEARSPAESAATVIASTADPPSS